MKNMKSTEGENNEQEPAEVAEVIEAREELLEYIRTITKGLTVEEIKDLGDEIHYMGKEQMGLQR